MSKIDWAMSEDGDLVLGAPSLDVDNNILYYHVDGTTSIDKFKDGVQGKYVRDLAYVIGRNAWKQIIFNRLKTDAPDWYHHPLMGGSLTDLIGEFNTRETGQIGVQLITNAVIYAGLAKVDQVIVKAVPINNEEIMFFVTINLDDDEPYQLPITFNLNYGLKEV